MEHHVYFWLKDSRLNHLDQAEFEKGLAQLLEIEHVNAGVWGKPAATMQREVVDNSWHYGLSLQFESTESHDRYQVAPAHQTFVDQFKDWWEKVEVRDLLPA